MSNILQYKWAGERGFTKKGWEGWAPEGVVPKEMFSDFFGGLVQVNILSYWG